MVRQHRIMYPKSTLRRKIGIVHAVSGVTFLLLILSFAWPIYAPTATAGSSANAL